MPGSVLRVHSDQPQPPPQAQKLSTRLCAELIIYIRQMCYFRGRLTHLGPSGIGEKQKKRQDVMKPQVKVRAIVKGYGKKTFSRPKDETYKIFP